MKYKKILSTNVRNLLAISVLLHTFSVNTFGDSTHLPPNIDLEDEILALLGDGIRNEYFIDVYHVGLYSDASSIEEIQLSDISHYVAVRIKVLTDVLPDTPPPYWLNLFDELLNQEQFSLFTDNYSKLKGGDVLAINYIPGAGTHIYMKKKKILVIKNNELISAVVKGFIGKKPVSDDLKESILDL